MRSFYGLIFSLVVSSAPVVHAEGAEAMTASRNKKVTVVANLSKNQIEQVIKANHAEVKSCHDRASEKQATLQGKVAIRFTIGATGEVIETAIAEDTVKNEQMANCIVTALQSWKFPEPHGGGKVTVTYPWHFRPKHAEP